MQPNTEPFTQPDQIPSAAPAPTVMPAGPAPVVYGGSPVVPTQPVAPYSEPAGVQAEAPRSRSLLKVVLAIVVLAALAGAFLGGYYTNMAAANAAQTAATAKAKDFIAALNAGDNSRAYAMGSSSMQQKQTESQFAATLGDLRDAHPTFSSELTIANGTRAIYSVVEGGLPATSSGDTNGTFGLTLVHNAGGWQIDSVNIQ